MGIASRSVLGISIAAAVVVVGGLALQGGRERAPPLRVASAPTEAPVTPASLRGTAPALVAAPPTADATHGAAAAVDSVTFTFVVRNPVGEVVDALVEVDYDGTSLVWDVPTSLTTRTLHLKAATQVGLRAGTVDRSIWSRRSELSVDPGDAHLVTLQLSGARYRGVVRDAVTRQPIQHAEVLARDHERHQPQDWSTGTRTSAEGAFDFALGLDQRPMQRVLQIKHRDYRSRVVPLPERLEPADVLLDPLPRCSGLVTLEDGSPALRADVRMTVRATAGALDRAGYASSTAIARNQWESDPGPGLFEDEVIASIKVTGTREVGSFDAPLEFPGDVVGYVRLKGYLAERFEVDQRHAGAPVLITLRRSPAPDGRIRLVRPDGTPYVGLRVSFREPIQPPAWQTITGGETNEDGWVDTSQLLEGATVRIHLSWPGARGREHKYVIRWPPCEPFTWVVRHHETLTVGAE